MWTRSSWFRYSNAQGPLVTPCNKSGGNLGTHPNIQIFILNPPSWVLPEARSFIVSTKNVNKSVCRCPHLTDMIRSQGQNKSWALPNNLSQISTKYLEPRPAHSSKSFNSQSLLDHKNPLVESSLSNPLNPTWSQGPLVNQVFQLINPLPGPKARSSVRSFSYVNTTGPIHK